ncbi:MAG: hypothetical protein COA52_04235 [Hyphomicrobiales bacterium]|nr:MAG: hypothetical protein COA52_04235 [Hyphomicrobiales bacterium]
MPVSKHMKILLLAGAFSAYTASAFAAEDKQIIHMPLSQLQWETTAEGVGFAPLQGERFQESYMAMVRLPAGLVSPPHVKTANMYGLVVSGTIANIALDNKDGQEVPLPPGSYYKVPAGLAHISKCLSKVDCVTFLYQDGKFDFLPITK